MLSSNKSYKRPDKILTQQFIILHYAGTVPYEIEGFVEKNKDTVSSLITSCLANSKNAVVKSIFSKIQQDEQAAGGPGKSLKGNSISN